MVTRHQFLTMLHDLLKPPVYLEVGVQYGLSLNLAVHSKLAVGIDPEPLVQAVGNQVIFPMTSQEYFEDDVKYQPSIDMAFIDGSHLWEDALEDFLWVSRFCHERSVVVFDDVLPYNADIATRKPLPGDWTGDVWYTMVVLEPLLKERGLKSARVNTSPTGTFVVWGFTQGDGAWIEENVQAGTPPSTPPADVLFRFNAYEAQDVVDRIKEDLCESQ